MNVILVEGFHDVGLIKAICDQLSPFEGGLRVEEMGGLPRPDRRDAQLNAVLRSWLTAPAVSSVGLVVDADADPFRIWRRLQRLPILSATVPMICDESIADNGFIAECYVGSIVRRFGVWIMPDNVGTGQLEDFVLRMVPDSDPVKQPAREFIRELPMNVVNPADHRVPKHIAHAWLSAYYPGRSFNDALSNGRLAMSPNDSVSLAFLNWLRRLAE